MKRASVLCLVSLALACDDNKFAAMLEASTTPSVTPSALSVVPSSVPTPPVVKKKEWKCAAAIGVVDFAGDEALEKEIRLKLKKPEGLITPADLSNPTTGIKSINLTKYGPVNELNPCVMPKLTQIHDLFIGAGELDDLSPIADLTTMISLRATDNKVKNLDPLKRLVHMDRLDLSHTQVADLTVLAQMTELTELEIDATNVTDLKPLEKLTKLNKVTLANTAVKDISPLRNSRDLHILDISGTPITDTSMLSARNLKVKNN
jgi:internalin A